MKNATEEPANQPELTLDPSDRADWESLRRVGHRMVDDMLEYLRTVRTRAVSEVMPEQIKSHFQEPLPQHPQALESVYEEFRERILPFPHGNIHPRFWGWVEGTGTPSGILAEMLAATLNSNAGFGDQAPLHVELQVLGWLKELFGFPAGAGGALVSGCSVANLSGLAIARNTHAGFDVRAKGLPAAGERLTVYGSVETHASSLRALEVLGLGREAFQAVPVDEQFQVRVDLLRERIRADRRSGARPLCVLGSAGSVNTGAFDDLNGLADLCAEEKLWLHVDGAFGALAMLSPPRRALLRGIGRADSLAFDLHKWLHVPYDAGCVLVRDGKLLSETFAMSAAYLFEIQSRFASGPINLMNCGVQMSRGFRALKVWMTIKEHGLEKLGALIEQNIQQASYLARRIEETPELELLAPVPLNIVCFRYAPPDMSGEPLDRLNRDVLEDLHRTGIAVPSHTRIHGHFAIRAAISNHRTRFQDLDLLLEEVVRLGRSKVERKAARTG